MNQRTDELQMWNRETFVPPDDNVDLRHWIQVVQTRKWVFLLAFAFSLAGAGAYLYFTPPVYEAKTVLVYEPERATSQLFDKAQPSAPQQRTGELEPYRKMLQSPLVLKDVYDQLKKRPDFHFHDLDALKKAVLLSTTSPLDSKVLNLAIRTRSADLSADIANLAVSVFLEKCEQQRNANLDNTVTFVQNQLKETEKTLHKSEGEIYKLLGDDGLTMVASAQANGERDAGLLAQLGKLQRDLAEAESHRDLAAAKQHALKQLIQSKSKRLQEAGLEAVTAGGITVRVQQLQAKIGELEVELATKRQTLQDEHPDVVALKRQISSVRQRLNTETANLAKRADYQFADPLAEWQNLVKQETDVAAEVEENAKRVSMIQGNIEAFKGKHPDITNKEVQLTQQQRRARQSEETLVRLSQRLGDLQMMRQMQAKEFTVIESALAPDHPIHPKKWLTLMLAGLFGLVAGTGGAFCVETMDDRVKGKDQVQRILAMPIIGEIPRFRKTKTVALSDTRNPSEIFATLPTEDDNSMTLNLPEERQERRLHSRYRNYQAKILSNLTPTEAEGYYRLQSTIRFMAPSAQAFLVASSVPEEGKTLTASNLAMAYAGVGKKTLLVDCDLRNPKIHGFLGVPPGPGVAEYLQHHTISVSETGTVGGDAVLPSADSIVHSTEVHNLFVVAGGKPSVTPSVIFCSDALPPLIEHWKEQFDVILIDSPPVLTATDAQELAAKVDAVIFVMRAGQTNGYLASRAREILERAGTQMLGVVLNAVDNGKMRDYQTYTAQYY